MRYPKFLTTNKTIHTVVTSFPIQGPYYTTRYDKAVENFTVLGYKIKEAEHIKISDEQSLLFDPSFEIKAAELLKAFKDKETDVVWSVAGGEVLVKTLDNINFNKIAKTPKWFVGFSDNTNIDFILTTKYDIATIYGYHFPVYGVTEFDKSMEKLLEFLNGKISDQESYERFESEHIQNVEQPTTPPSFTTETCWKSLNENDIHVKGRIIGGCLDCLINLCGGKYDTFNKFKKKYKKDGVILYMEACDLNVVSQLRAFNQLENAGWFEGIKCFIIGRPLNSELMYDLNYEKMLHSAFDHLNIPVIFDFDTGHTSPMMTIVNGSMVEIYLENKKGLFRTFLI